jgi:hypothetical protein
MFGYPSPGSDFDPDEFLRNMAGYIGMAPDASTTWARAAIRWD